MKPINFFILISISFIVYCISSIILPRYLTYTPNQFNGHFAKPDIDNNFGIYHHNFYLESANYMETICHLGQSLYNGHEFMLYANFYCSSDDNYYQQIKLICLFLLFEIIGFLIAAIALIIIVRVFLSSEKKYQTPHAKSKNLCINFFDCKKNFLLYFALISWSLSIICNIFQFFSNNTLINFVSHPIIQASGTVMNPSNGEILHFDNNANNPFSFYDQMCHLNKHHVQYITIKNIRGCQADSNFDVYRILDTMLKIFAIGTFITWSFIIIRRNKFSTRSHSRFGLNEV